MKAFMLRTRVAGSEKTQVIDYMKCIVQDNREDFSRYGFFDSTDSIFIFENEEAKKAFMSFVAFNDTIERLTLSYVTLGLISEEEADSLYNEDLHSLPMPDQPQALYCSLMELIKDR